MKYVLIDTNILKSSFIGKTKYSGDLKQLKFWVDSEKVTILCPEILKSEWQKHKEVERSRIEKVLRKKRNELELDKLFGVEKLDQRLENARITLYAQINDLDKIFENGLLIPQVDSDSVLAVDHFTKSLPPFHKKKDSFKDALAIFSTLRYFENSDLGEFIFVTSDADFRDQGGSSSLLSHEIVQYFSNVTVTCFEKSNEFIRSLISIGLPKFSDAQHSDVVRVILKSHKGGTNTEIDYNRHLLLHFDDLVNSVYDQLNFVPLHTLINKYPLRIRYSYYDNFEVESDNHELKEFFDSFSIDEKSNVELVNPSYFDSIAEPAPKIQEIFNHFSRNLVYYFQVDGQDSRIDTRLFEESSCCCIRCQFEKFDFKGIDFSYSLKESELTVLMNKAYGHYKVGHFKNAYWFLCKAQVEAEKEGKELSSYLIEYNMVQLSYMIERHYYDDNEAQEILEKISEIDLSNKHCEGDNKFHLEIKEWMLNDYFMKHFHLVISELKQKIVDHYHNSLNGGSGSNNYIGELVNYYAQLNQFLQLNMIIKDCYHSYKNIVELLIEALFASYSVHGNRSSKIVSLNDWSLTQILKYGDIRSIHRLARRYKLKNVKYSGKDKDSDSIEDLLIRVVRDCESAFDKVKSIEEPNYNYFKHQYRGWINNAIYLAALINFEKKFVKEFSIVLIDYLEKDILDVNTTEIVNFVVSKEPILTKRELRKFFILGIRDKISLRSHFLHNMAILCQNRGIAFRVPQRDINSIVQDSLSRRSNIDSIIHVYRCLYDNNQKEIVLDKILGELQDNFALDLWNTSLLHEVIPLKEEELLKALEILTPKKKILGTPFNPFGEARYNAGLDRLIENCFKYGLDLTEPKFDGLRKHSKYYQWLLNLDSFDYSLFESTWILDYGTYHYFKRFSNCIPLKNHIEKLISEGRSETYLKEAYVNIYVKGTYNK